MGESIDQEQDWQVPWPCSAAQLATSTFSPASGGADGTNHLGLLAGDCGLGSGLDRRSQGVWPGSTGCCGREQKPQLWCLLVLLAQAARTGFKERGTASTGQSE